MSTAIIENILLEACHNGDYNKYLICMNELNYLHMTWDELENIFSNTLLGGNNDILHDVLNIILVYSQKGILWQFGYTLEKLAMCKTINQMNIFVNIFSSNEYYLKQIFIGSIKGSNIDLLDWLSLNYLVPDDILMYIYMTTNDNIIHIYHNRFNNYDFKYAMTGACIAKDLNRMNILYYDYQVRDTSLNHALDKVLELYETYETIIVWLLEHGATNDEQKIVNWFNTMKIIRNDYNTNVIDIIINKNRLNKNNKYNKYNNNYIADMYDEILDNLTDYNLKNNLNLSSEKIIKKITGIRFS